MIFVGKEAIFVAWFVSVVKAGSKTGLLFYSGLKNVGGGSPRRVFPQSIALYK